MKDGRDASATPSHFAALPKSVDRTVFVRFRPASSSIRRHHLEELFSQVGPIKKTSVVHAKANDKVAATAATNSSSSYGFVKYSAEQDARKAVELNRKTITVDGQHIQVIVEAASASGGGRGRHGTKGEQPEELPTSTSAGIARHEPRRRDEKTPLPSNVKNQTRLILRNVGFATNEQQIRKIVAARFGPVSEVHLPPVPATTSTSTSSDRHPGKIRYTHRGFGFVTFDNPEHASQCVAASPLSIGNRDVAVAYTRNKTLYEQERQKKNQSKEEVIKKPPRGSAEGSDEVVPKKDESTVQQTRGEGVHAELGDDNNDDEDDDESRTSESDSDDEGKSEDESEGASGSVNDDVDKDDQRATDEGKRKRDEAIAERRVVFLRNLPFDATRHDVFELLRKYGRIESIHLVKKDGGLFQGSCFVHFATKAAAERLVNAHNQDSSKFAPQNQGTDDFHRSSSGGLQLRGRTVLVDWAVDKETAAAVVSDRDGNGRDGAAKDRRNLYLKGEGRVDDPVQWQALPLTDQQKRQRAWSDKLTKLKSPLFFINPTRLSIRNLAKSIDEKKFKQLCVQATQRGLERKLVSVEDLLLHWKAKGDMSHREILAKVQEAEETGADLMPAFDGNNVRHFIPSVFIDRDFTGTKAGGEAPSRGFGFVEFTHHVHALACLRELNNNQYYAQHVAGGTVPAPKKKDKKKDKRGAVDDEVAKSPRLIVEFVVENAAKAKQQALHRAQQESNQRKQKQEKSSQEKKERKKSRGALQRERKRKAREEAAGGEPVSHPEEKQASAQARSRESSSSMNPGQPTSERSTAPAPSSKPVKPAKKRKVDPEEAKFSDLVESYKRSFNAAPDAGMDLSPSRDVSRRWFDD